MRNPLVNYTLTRAREADTETVVGLLNGRVEWLAQHGYDQWSEKDPARATAATIAAGETWLLVDDQGAAAGTITITTRADRDFWTADEAAVPALYVSKLATPLELAGQGIGELLLHAAYFYGQARRVEMLRWDVWRTNIHLQQYYAGLGAELVRTMDVPGRRSGALFEWRTPHGRVWAAGSAKRVRIDAPQATIQQVETHRVDAWVILGAEDYPREGPDHKHHLTGLWWADDRIVVAPTDVGPSVLTNPGDGWQIVGRPVYGPALDGLRAGLPYLVQHDGIGRDCAVVITGDVLEPSGQLQHH